MAAINLPFAASATKRAPTTAELADGYGCGPADLELFDFMAWWTTGQIDQAITDAGLTTDDADLQQLSKVIRRRVAFRGVALFTSSGTFDPAALGLTTLDRILVFCWGAGGGGASTTGTRGASGAGGGLAIKSMDCPASSVTVTIGAGGAGNNAGSYGVTGGTSSFGPHCSATGGVGGSAGAGAGGAGTGGSINLSGSAGCDILSPEQDWGPGGSAPFMGPGMLNNGGANPIGSGGAASAGAPQADAGHDGAVIVFY